jgi:very-short-patch-repair endonuclease
VVQFDGDYWHGNPAKYPNPTSRQKKCMALDRSQDAYLRACGYEVVRVWESELRTDPNVLLTRLQRVRGQLPLQEAAP